MLHTCPDVSPFLLFQHYTGTSIFEILSTVYTAVTFHELFKEAAMDANSKLDFGVEWQEIFTVLQSEVGT